ncbi:MAG: type IX secretion system sortase PorU, partial [Bacteroidia bacterium]
AEYSILSAVQGQTEVWDITNPLEPQKRNLSFSGSTAIFRAEADSLREFIAFGSTYLTPKAVGSIMNQNLHALSQVDMVIVAHPSFLSEANRLADFHRNSTNISVHVVTPYQIYNEFSSGAQDITAIRDFMRMFYERAQIPEEKPRFLLLFGDGSIDNKHRVGGNTNFIPTFQSLESLYVLSSYVSDDFYGSLDPSEGNWDTGNVNNESVDVGIGRLPVKNLGEAKAVVDKIIRYSSPLNPSDFNFEFSANGYRKGSYGDWRNIIAFMADDEDGTIHMLQANQTAISVENKYPNYITDKIYFDAYKQVSTPGGERYPDAKDAMNKRIDRGALIFNYTGHGGELGLGHERVLEIADVNSWKNINNLPAFFTATCEFSRFDDPYRTSAGELTFLNPNGGAIALFTTTRVVNSGANSNLNNAFYNQVFEPEPNGEMPFMGDVFRRTKNTTSGGVNDLNFSLLGDPAQKLAYPKHGVVTTKINDKAIGTDPDTIQGLSKVTVEGMVVDNNGQKMSGFTGILYPTVFDKKSNITTLGQGSNPFNFNLKKNILYKGKASVINGDFTFTFLVPKDISYNFDLGSFSYYAHNGTEDAHGNYSNIMVGGIDTTAKADNVGPDIKLYMNDEKFIFGGMTDENPLLYALVFDSCGINTAGSSIGHDITAILDEKTDKSIILNDYYQADLDSYQSGRIRYPFSKLAEGHHTLTLKVWDVQNNSSQAYTEFIVSSSANLALNHVFNYPNPFTTHTTFLFEHNRPNTPLDVQIQVFTVSGKLVKTINQPVFSEGFRSDSIEWDGLDDYGDRIGRGVYIYRLRVRSGDSYADQLEKLVILK